MSDKKTLNPVIHAAFRRDLRRFDDAFERFDAGAQSRADQLCVAWDNFSYQLHHHHDDEENFFWPAFRELGVEPSIMNPLEEQHEVMVKALEAAEHTMAAFKGDPSADNAKTAQVAIAELNRILCDHLDQEERTLDPFSERNAKTKQHKAAETSSRKAHTEGAGNFFSWLSDGIDAPTAQILRGQMPAPALWMLTHLGGRDYRHRIAPTWA